MRRRTLLVVLAGLAVVGAAGVVLLRLQEDRVTRANYDRIQIGMSRADVEAILGPPGDYSTTQMAYLLEDPWPVESWPSDDRVVVEEWCYDKASIDVAFTPTGTVMRARFWTGSLTDPEEDSLDNLRWRLEDMWHRWFP
jgi:hypothetical protein